MNQKKRILVCPLDWGLGHATRCVPVIKELLDNDVDVIIGAKGGTLALLMKEFPQLEFIQLPGYNIRYSNRSFMVLKMLISIPKMLKGIVTEKKAINRLVFSLNLDGVISDNRFGLWSHQVKSVFITHQINIKSPVFEIGLNKINRWFINHYDFCWIPDVGDTLNLSGDLSHHSKLKIPSRWLGLLSRFYRTDLPNVVVKENKILAILSGPEPQRTVFEKLLMAQLSKNNLEAVIVQGIPTTAETSSRNNITVHSHLETEELAAEILSAEVIICRSGYSTLMDLSVFGKKVVLVPTPGQTEQEYLASYLKNRNEAVVQSQNNFDLKEALQLLTQTKPLQKIPKGNLLKPAVQEFLNSIP